MAASLTHVLEEFRWAPQPGAQAVVAALVGRVLESCPMAVRVKQRLQAETGSRLEDWIDHIALGNDAKTRADLLANGFLEARAGVFGHPGGIFPTVVMDDGRELRLGLRVEAAADFLAAWDLSDAQIEGEPLAALRRARVDGGEGGSAQLWVVERHGYRGFDVPRTRVDLRSLEHGEALRRRRRVFSDEAAGFAHAQRLIDAAVTDLGVDRTCDIFFAAEREYWQRRNRAARIQKARQDQLGLGWANHDHHTYRSSRRHFAALIGVLERMGFVCRERFYAGAEAGWGAQVLEQSNAGVVVFADVDLSADELARDFAHEPLEPRQELGTVGLWCALHGEAFLQAGMHHLECRFDFAAVAQQLQKEGVGMMKPFTDLAYLKQEFTQGEIWPVRQERIDALRVAGQISAEQAAQFAEHGAIGSHLENLQRDEGFKGFNQRGVSEIIACTDPRRQNHYGA
jgi:hypothetical protein